MIIKAEPQYGDFVPKTHIKKVRWEMLHQEFVSVAKQSTASLSLLGDSIVSGLSCFCDVWCLSHDDVDNLGIGGDRCQHVLWRVFNGEIPNHSRYVLLSVGTNNIHSDLPVDIADTIMEIVRVLQGLDKIIIVHGILPQDDYLRGRLYKSCSECKAAINSVNTDVQERCQPLGAMYINPSSNFQNDNVDNVFHHDRLHLSPMGNNMFTEAILNATLCNPIRIPTSDEYEYAIGEPEQVSPIIPPMDHNTLTTNPFNKPHTPLT